MEADTRVMDNNSSDIDIVVLTKGVPDFREGKVSFDEHGHLERGKTPTVMNPNDRFALKAALQTKVRSGGKITVMSMGPPGYKEILQEAMNIYADDLYLLSDREMAAADTWATSITICTAIEKLDPKPDIIFAGFKTADGETGHTGPQTSWALQWPIITHVVSIDVNLDEKKITAKRLVQGDIKEVETVEVELPCFVIPDPEFEAEYPKASHRLRLQNLTEETRERAISYEETLTMWDHKELNLDPDYIGLDGSPTIVGRVDPIPKAPAEREATIINFKSKKEMEEVLGVMAPFAGED